MLIKDHENLKEQFDSLTDHSKLLNDFITRFKLYEGNESMKNYIIDQFSLRLAIIIHPPSTTSTTTAAATSSQELQNSQNNNNTNNSSSATNVDIHHAIDRLTSIVETLSKQFIPSIRLFIISEKCRCWNLVYNNNDADTKPTSTKTIEKNSTIWWSSKKKEKHVRFDLVNGSYSNLSCIASTVSESKLSASRKRRTTATRNPKPTTKRYQPRKISNERRKRKRWRKSEQPPPVSTTRTL